MSVLRKLISLSFDETVEQTQLSTQGYSFIIYILSCSRFFRRFYTVVSCQWETIAKAQRRQHEDYFCQLFKQFTGTNLSAFQFVSCNNRISLYNEENTTSLSEK